ncbi:VAMP-like protein YKT61 [Sesamum angolense]|uniref:VAMP-like protein YKT61 n=1 Tax=Sesamum angolense TaxID=2727404 RepID=A0AAE1WDQ6_9LAMI|nr:VAMP-like protein YKT61 [Sesamum angolense]
MVKITALMVLKCTPEGADPVILANASDLSSFGFFQRPSVKEFIVFVGRTVAKRTPPGQRQSKEILSDLLSVGLPEYKVHSYNQNGLCALGFMDDHYPVRSAFSLLNKVLEEYQKNFGDSWKTVQADNSQQWPYLNEALTKFQDPAEADKLLKIQRELDETKIILHKTIDSVLARGEKLDSLVEKSSDLSAASQVFQISLHYEWGKILLDPNLEMSNHDWAESVNILGSQAEFDSLATLL